MDFGTILVLAVALSMDAFAVSICKGLAMKKTTVGKAAVVGAWFGVFQGMMPMIGYLLGIQFAGFITKVAPWVAFILLAFIGGNMVREACSKEEEEADDSLHVKEMFLLAVATSIDALAVGITFAMVPVTVLSDLGMAAGNLLNTIAGTVVIGITTFVLSMTGVKVGSIFGTRYKSKAELAGGIVLILIGLKILLESFGII